MWLRILALISMTCLFAPISAMGELPWRMGPVYTDRAGEVSVVVELPQGFTPEASDFRLMDGGEVLATGRRDSSFKESRRGLALVLCVDVSKTMKGDPLKDTRDALLAFLRIRRADRPDDRVALVSFADEVAVESSFEDKPDQLFEQVRGLRPRGRFTRLYQALYTALDMLQAPRLPERRRIIVISDGKDEGSAESLETVSRKARERGIPIDAVGRGKIDSQYFDALAGLARQTGGQSVPFAPDRVSVQDALDRLYWDLLETTRVVTFSYEMEEPVQRTRTAEIELLRPGGGSEKAPLPVGIPVKKAPKVTAEKNGVQGDGVKVPPPPPEKSWLERLLLKVREHPWTFLLLGALLVGGVIALWAQRPRQKPVEGVGAVEAKRESASVGEASEPAEGPVSAGILVEGEEARTVAAFHPSERRTLVGAYTFPTPRIGEPAAALVGMSGPMQGERFLIQREHFAIGAAQDNDLPVSRDDFVSRHHAAIRYEKGSLVILDSGSRNGTFVNEAAVTDAGCELQTGDLIRVGESVFRVEEA